MKLVLDHHVGEDDLGAELFKDYQAEATGRLVVEAADALGVRLDAGDRPAAVGGVGHRHRLVPLRLDRGGDIPHGGPAGGGGCPARPALPGALRRRHVGAAAADGLHVGPSQTELGGRLIYTWIEQSDFGATGAVPSDSEDLINMTLTVGGTEVAVILVEQPTGGFKVSFRSRSKVDCSRSPSSSAAAGTSRPPGR